MTGALLLTLAVLAQAPAPAPAVDAGLPALRVPIDRSTPRVAVQGFLDAVHDDEPMVAAHYLNLDFLPVTEQPIVGPTVARRLAFLIERGLKLTPDDVALLPSTPAGQRVVLGRLRLSEQHLPLALERLSGGTSTLWLFSADTVRSVDALYAAYRPPFGEKMPAWLLRRPLGTLPLWQWTGMLLALGLAAGLAIFLERLLLALFARMARLTSLTWDDELVVAARGPLRTVLGAGLLSAGLAALALPLWVQHGFDLLVRSLAIAAVAWFALRTLALSAKLLERGVTGDDVVDARARGIQTQFALLRRVAQVAIWIIAAALFLMQFELVRNVGVSLLASAGVAGLVIGLAAQKSISTLLAGIQLSLTQPIRIGDYVVLEGESGNVEEISFTFVVVRIWDGRRLVVPITYFLEKPFQNWNKGDPKQLGAVTLEVDFQADVDVFRAALQEVLEGPGRALWDGVTQGIVITEARERTLTLRALVGAKRFGGAWDLRCLVRERLVRVLREHPEWMAQVRTLGGGGQA